MEIPVKSVRLLLTAAPLIALAILALTPVRGVAQGPSAPTTRAPRTLKVVDRAWMDSSVKACTDFFQYANGSWLAHDTIPEAYASSGVTRDMSDVNELVVRSVLDDAVHSAPASRRTAPRGSWGPSTRPAWIRTPSRPRG
jgi:putative endopeptidase